MASAMAGGVSVVLPCIITCAKGLRFLSPCVKHVQRYKTIIYIGYWDVSITEKF